MGQLELMISMIYFRIKDRNENRTFAQPSNESRSLLSENLNLTELAPLFILYAMYLPLKGLSCFADLGKRPPPGRKPAGHRVSEKVSAGRSRVPVAG